MKSFKKLARRFRLAVPASPRVPSLSSSTARNVEATIRAALVQAGLQPGPRAGARPRTGQAPAAPAPAPRPAPRARATASGAGGGASRAAPPATPASRGQGTSSLHTVRHAAGTRNYLLYEPPGSETPSATGMPLLVMLHGCTQSPDDFATGTRMNALADAHGVLVAYPEQTARDNGSRCWNWFRREDQQRGRGEPALLAAVVEDIASRRGVDRSRVYVAGLSAGAAMAVILGRTYPEVFAAVGAHSGLPYAAAQDVPGAFAAMQGRGAPRSRPDAAPSVPTIVLHGTADRTVQAGNGEAIVDDALAAHAGSGALRKDVADARMLNGRQVTHTVYAGADGRAPVEHVVIQGAGHAWSGGDPAGSHTDAQGPDASALILAFCLRHAR